MWNCWLDRLTLIIMVDVIMKAVHVNQMLEISDCGTARILYPKLWFKYRDLYSI